MNIDDLNTNWRKVASTIYDKPTDSKIYGHIDLDVTELEAFVSEKRKQGIKITLTHLFVMMLARGLSKDVPELNAYVSRGKIIPRKSLDVMVSVLQASGEMGSIRVKDADRLSLEEVAIAMREEINKTRKEDSDHTMQKKGFIASMPWPFRSWFYWLYKTVVINWGMKIPGLSLTPESFGSFVVTNIGSIGLTTGFPALLPSSNVAFVVVMGGIDKKPVVINDEITIRRMMSVSVTLDHRVADASHMGRLLRSTKVYLKKPALLEEKD